jgi:preprotein translocase subunit SecD
MIKWSRLVLFLVVVGLLGGLFTTTGQVANNITLGLDLKGGFEILYQVEPLNEGQQVDTTLLAATAQMVEKRVNIGGVTEPEVNVELPDRIRVRIASQDADQTKLRELIGKPAVLTFRDIEGKILMRGSDLAPGGAKVDYDDLKKPMVTVKFTDPKLLEDVTRAHLHQPMGIYLDDTLQTNPTIQSVISGGSAQITGDYTTESAQELADLLNSGAMPAKLIEKQVTSVGATLGAMSLNDTLKAGYVGGALILIFMLVVYRLPGFVANITLVAFIYLSLLFLDWMDATLTLPGIAGFILGIGMAVDANIITYERIQEEIRSGKTILSAFRAGERRSLVTILDAQITAMIAAAVLYFFGTSSIQGFAIITMLTTIVSIFTNVFFSRFLLGLLIRTNLFKKPVWFGVKESEISEL